jgi:hypothetical protein
MARILLSQSPTEEGKKIKTKTKQAKAYQKQSLLAANYSRGIIQKDSTGREAQTARLSLQVDAAKVGEAHPWLEGLDWGQRKQAKTLALAPYPPRRLACINRESFVVRLAG